MRTLCEEKTKSRRLRSEECALRTTSRLPLAARTLRAMRAWFWLTERCLLHAAQSSGPVPGPEGPDNLMKDCTKSCPRIRPDHVLPVGARPLSCSGLSCPSALPSSHHLDLPTRSAAHSSNTGSSQGPERLALAFNR